MKLLLKSFAAASIFFLTVSFVYAGTKDPVGVIFKPKGTVEYTKKGKTWKKVRRNKFLFAGYQIKTGADGSGSITIKATGKNFQLGPNSLVLVTKDGLQAKQGSLESTSSASILTAGLMKKFSKSQAYTTVRRSAGEKNSALKAARELTLTDEHPDLVFSSIGDEYSYKVAIGKEIYEIPATKDEMVRLKLQPFSGTQDLKITALKNGEATSELKPYKTKEGKKKHTVTWLSGDEKEKLQNSIKGVREEYGDAEFITGTLFEEKDMWVAAMDQYKQYLADNPDEIEMTPYLFRVYKKLHLDDTYRKELEKWRTAMME